MGDVIVQRVGQAVGTGAVCEGWPVTHRPVATALLIDATLFDSRGSTKTLAEVVDP